MRKTTMLTAALALAGLAFGAQAQLPGAQQFEQCDELGSSGISMDGSAVAARKSVAAHIDEMLELQGWLISEAPRTLAKSAGFSVELSRQDQYQLGLIDCAECERLSEQERRMLVGLAREVGHVVDFSRAGAKQLRGDGEFERGALGGMADGGFVWTAKLASPGASGLRLALSGLDLPANAALYVFNDRGEAFGPYLGTGVNGSGEVTTNMVSGDVAYLQLRVFGTPKSMQGLSFRIDSIGHISSRFELAEALDAAGGLLAKTHCTSGRVNAGCVENAMCSGTFSHISNLRNAIGAMLYASGSGYYICTGGLIANTADDPLFLTANHCISKSSEANTLEVYWNHTVPCGTRTCQGAWEVQGRASEVGATIRAGSSTGDYTLMQLNSTLPTGGYKLGWNSTPVAGSSNAQLYRVSHPNGAPQAYSEQRVNTSAGTCRTLPRGTYIYSTDNFGATEGGSSGSPVVNGQNQIVGQLYGACGSNLNDVCDSGSNRTVDGAFAAYFSAVESILTGGGGDPGTGFTLTGSGSKVKGAWRASLSWSGSSGNVNVYRGGSAVASNIGGSSYVDQTSFKGSGSLTYKVCNTSDTSVCSNEVTISF